MRTKSRIAIVLTSLMLGVVGIFAAFAGADASSPPVGFNPIHHQLAPANHQALVDAWKGQQASVTAQTVFGTDDRIQITDTTVSTFRAVVWLGLFDDFNNLLGTCSGSIIGPGVVLTAAHCLYTGGAYTPQILVIPGANGDDFPFGSAVGTNEVVPQGWGDGVGALSDELVPPSPFDFGLVLFNPSSFGNSLLPYFTVAPVTDAFLSDPSVVIATAGYPGFSGTMWFTAADQSEYDWDSTYLYTLMDISPGQSGSPIFALSVQDFKPYVFSVVSGGNNISNRSVRFTSIVVNALNQWCAEDGCQIAPTPLADVPVVVPNATSSPSPSSTPTPTSSPTPTPPSPTSTPSPSPTATPSPTASTTPSSCAEGTQTISLQPRWTLVGWIGMDTPVADALTGGGNPCVDDVSQAISVIWAWDAASQSWHAYFPSVTIAGANDLTTLERGVGYFIALSDTVSGPIDWKIVSA